MSMLIVLYYTKEKGDCQMQKLIRVTWDNSIEFIEYPENKSITEENECFYKLIGNDCRCVERVTPIRLYKELCHKRYVTEIDGEAVCMLVDEEGLLKDNFFNSIASYLYKTDEHCNPIQGNVLFVGEKWTRDGITFCGINEVVSERLFKQLQEATIEAERLWGDY